MPVAFIMSFVQFYMWLHVLHNDIDMESAFDKRKLVYWGHSKDILNLSISDYKLHAIFHASTFLLVFALAGTKYY